MQKLHVRLEHIMITQMKMKQKDIAKALSKDPSLVSKHLSGDAPITADDLEVYAKLLSTTPRELLEGTYEWQSPEYQEFTYYIPRHESLEKMRNKEAVEAVEEKKPFKFNDPFLKGIFLGTTVASLAGLAVNIFAHKHSDKKS